MRKLRLSTLLLILVLPLMTGSALAQDQRGVFAVFLCDYGPVDTALSISNVLAAPPGIAGTFQEKFTVTEGTLEFYFWDEDGTLVFYETGPESPGAGLTELGTLSPGQSYRVLLSEILAAAGYQDDFVGYGWVVANFQGVQGTANVTDWGRFTQATVMQPDLGTTFFDVDANAGVPISAPPQ